MADGEMNSGGTGAARSFHPLALPAVAAFLLTVGFAHGHLLGDELASSVAAAASVAALAGHPMVKGPRVPTPSPRGTGWAHDGASCTSRLLPLRAVLALVAQAASALRIVVRRATPAVVTPHAAAPSPFPPALYSLSVILR